MLERKFIRCLAILVWFILSNVRFVPVIGLSRDTMTTGLTWPRSFSTRFVYVIVSSCQIAIVVSGTLDDGTAPCSFGPSPITNRTTAYNA